MLTYFFISLFSTMALFTIGLLNNTSYETSDDDIYATLSSPYREFCRGTKNGRNSIIFKDLKHYHRLEKSFIRCRRIIGNLEITHIDENDIQQSWAKVIQKNTDDTTAIPSKEAFHFLKDIEEITGYLLIFNVNVPEISLPNLKIIWGQETHEGNALQVDANNRLHYLNLPSLRIIDEGNMTIRQSPRLCYMDPGRNIVDYSELLGESYEDRLNVNNSFSKACSGEIKPCSKKCQGSCFGPQSYQCQTIYRRQCPNCKDQSCYSDTNGAIRCCNDACTGGCTGSGPENCLACKRFEQDGKCVNECRGTHTYVRNKMLKVELDEEHKRYCYGRHCVRACPSGTLIEDKYCVTRCSDNHYRDINKDDKRCVQCPGSCPKVCQMNDDINSINIRQLVNCSEIEGNIVILNHVFDEHIPELSQFRIDSRIPPTKVAALTVNDLNLLKTVKVVTGYVVVEGGSAHSYKKPASLNFLENLEIIEGRFLYHDQFSLYVMENYELKWLGLRSLRKIKNGGVMISNNKNLCYGYSVPFNKLGAKFTRWKTNKDKIDCELSNRYCDASCDSAWGCWGPGAGLCVQCRNFTRDGICAEYCPEEGYFISTKDPRNCMRCHEQCLKCTGSQQNECSKCRSFEYLHSENHRNPLLSATMTLKCVAKCPNGTYAQEQRCYSCNESCYEFGCSGSSAILGPGGCDRCRYAVEEENHTKRIRCLIGEPEEEDSVCGRLNGLQDGYYLSVGSQNESKYMCSRCRPECRTCRRDTAMSSFCDCINYRLVVNESQTNDDICLNDCARGYYIVANKSSDHGVGICKKCHQLCDDHFSCSGPSPYECFKCANVTVQLNATTTECLKHCPSEKPYPYEGFCYDEDKALILQRRRIFYVAFACFSFILFTVITAYLIYRCTMYRRKYERETQMHLPEIPPLDPHKMTQRPNMRRLNLIELDDLEHSKNCILGSGAFGIVYAGKWKPPGRKDIKIPVAIKAINPSETKNTTEKEMMKEAGLMASVQHEHLLPLVGICVAKGGLKIVTLLRPLGSLLQFLHEHTSKLVSRNLILYCYQISSAMEYLSRRKIVHRDLAARNVLVKNIDHVEVTDFGLAAMLQTSESSIIVEGRVAVKWLAIESLRQQVYNEKTDVWAFGITCWEIITYGQTPYKNKNSTDFPKDQRFAREFLTWLERGHRLEQPPNCSQEFYNELLSCWLEDPDSRPTFSILKSKFANTFCKAPHSYIQDRHSTERMDSITSYDQRLLIERLLKDSDFLDPGNIDPNSYVAVPSTPQTVTTEPSVTTPSIKNDFANGRNISPLLQRGPRLLKLPSKLISIDSIEEEGETALYNDEATGYTAVVSSTVCNDPFNPHYLNGFTSRAYVNDLKLPRSDDDGVQEDLITLSPSPSLTGNDGHLENNNSIRYRQGYQNQNEQDETSF